MQVRGGNLEVGWIEDQVEHFNMWATNSGVFAVGHASMEHRLRDREEACDLVSQYLDALDINLHYLIAMTNGEKTVLEESATSSPPQKRADVDTQDDQTQSPSDESPPLSPVSSENSFSQSEPNTKAPDQCFVAKFEVEDILSRLMRLSNDIRHGGFKDQSSKADNFVDRDAEGNDLTAEFARIVTIIVEHRYPEATESLRRRLADSVAQRRNRLAYLQRHQQKLAMADNVRISTTETDKKLENQGSQPIGHTHNSPGSQFVTEASKGHLLSTLSTTSPTKLQSEYRSSCSSVAPSQGSASVSSVSAGNATLQFPSAPKLGKQDLFECPYCLLLCPVKAARGKSWERHIMEDLEPYLCLFPSCREAKELYSNFDNWIHHMRIQHLASKWNCFAHPRGREVFDSSDSYIEHMKSFHTLEFVPSELPILSAMTERKSSQVFTNCPLCNTIPTEIAERYSNHETAEAQDALQDHVAHHLKSLALLSISWIGDEESNFSSHAHRGLSHGESSAPETSECLSGTSPFELWKLY